MTRCPEGHSCIWCGAKVGADHRDARHVKPVGPEQEWEAKSDCCEKAGYGCTCRPDWEEEEEEVDA